MKHKHAELMAQYALDAMETNEPWLRWEFYNKTFGRRIDSHVVTPSWYEQTEYRRKPQTKNMTIPEDAETIVFRPERNIVMEPRIQEISLRDYFAAKAMASMIVHDARAKVVEWAYLLADAMIEARKVKEESQ